MNENLMIMRRAKQQLANKWINVAIGTLIYLALLSLSSYTYLIGMIIYGPLTFGYYLYLACNIDTGVNNLNLLFKGFERFAETLVAGLLYFLAVSIGCALLIVPGIIAACGLSMTFFIMVDDPNISGMDALQKSWNMMRGQKWNFFCLNLRFIGWILLSTLTCGIGYIFLTPYMVAAAQNFYRKLRYGTY
ncbi:MAG: DUF975 family protein [Muribaculaceae bacterium]|nr:DUF975 family protein [Muribaculaceae bacterium]